ncbi:hypothetical protein, partial [Gloeocapsopsis dulcis]|uniref:IS1/IS1595 family N-terminal zinc-binding domain-containing protein n=1 Tax=Gloeocapsopsis dulcis TaxID=2859516 RepID=UPI001F271A78
MPYLGIVLRLIQSLFDRASILCGLDKVEEQFFIANLMECPLCGHVKVHKHGKMPSGVQRY